MWVPTASQRADQPDRCFDDATQGRTTAGRESAVSGRRLAAAEVSAVARVQGEEEEEEEEEEAYAAARRWLYRAGGLLESCSGAAAHPAG
jgi:hypothetical protein